MTTKLLLLITLVFSTLFLFYVPTGKAIFPFSDMVLNSDTYAYFLFEHVILIILAWIIYDVTKQRITLLYLLIQIIDTFDYILTYGEPWFDGNILTWNTIKVGIFGVAILYEKYGRQ